MERIKTIGDKAYIKMRCAFESFIRNDEGDTNFISIALIVAIVVVIAGLFLTVGKDAMDAIKTKVTDFISNPS